MTAPAEIVIRLQLEYAQAPPAEPPQLDALLYRPPEVAKLLAISDSSVYELIASGDLESVKLGGARRVHRDAIVEYLQRLPRGRGDG